jgi:hypothetical protein
MKGKNFEGIFHLLDHIKIDSIDEGLIQERINWVLSASSVNQMEYVVNFTDYEPKKNSFHMLHQVILSLNDPKLFEIWEQYEMKVCRRRLVAEMANMRAICKHYNIEYKCQAKEELFSFKFPHELSSSEANSDTLAKNLAKKAFPLSRDQKRLLPNLTISEQLKGHVREALNGGGQKKLKNK